MEINEAAKLFKQNKLIFNNLVVTKGDATLKKGEVIQFTHLQDEIYVFCEDCGYAQLSEIKKVYVVYNTERLDRMIDAMQTKLLELLNIKEKLDAETKTASSNLCQ